MATPTSIGQRVGQRVAHAALSVPIKITLPGTLAMTVLGVLALGAIGATAGVLARNGTLSHLSKAARIGTITGLAVGGAVALTATAVGATAIGVVGVQLLKYGY